MDFIGTKFNTPKGGILTVVGKLPKEPGKSHPKYQLECSICSKDTELFPELFTSVKCNLVNGRTPCGCSKKPNWTKEQYKIIITRKIKDNYKFFGFVGTFKGAKTTIKLYCTSCEYEWEPILYAVGNGNGCPCCAGKAKYTAYTATAKIMEIIKDKYEFRGFIGGWNGVLYTKVKLWCLFCGRTWEPTYNSVVNNGTGCPCCASSGYQLSKPGKLYVIKYTTKSNQTFLKYGITNREANQRSKQQVKQSGTTGEILHVYEFEDGAVPLQIENEIHDLRDEVGYVETSREEFPDGFTETLDVRYEKDVLAIIRKYVPEYEERLCA